MVLQRIDIENIQRAELLPGESSRLGDIALGVISCIVSGVMGGRYLADNAAREVVGEPLGIGGADGEDRETGKGGSKWKN